MAATTMKAPAAPARRQGGLIQRVPTWVWVAIPVTAGGVYFIWRRRQNSSVSAAPAVTPNTPTYGNPSDLTGQIYDMSGILAATTGTTGATADGSNAAAWTIPQGEKQVGSGYTLPTGTGVEVADKTGSKFRYIPNPTALQDLVKAGQAIYYQVLPGIFLTAKGQTLKPGTPMFLKEG